jgi:hypothetical protein
MISTRAGSILKLSIIGATLIACADIAAPNRSEAYEWRRLEPSASGGVDTLTFHWPRSALPVKVWAEDVLDLPLHVQHGMDRWQAAFLYREFQATLVSDSNVADVIVATGIPPKTGFAVIRLESLFAPECQGGTDVELTPDETQIQLPFRVFVDPRVATPDPALDQCMDLTVTHELGHAFGIFNHSPRPTDIMFADPTVPELSPGDQATAELAYHTEPNLTVAPR